MEEGSQFFAFTQSLDFQAVSIAAHWHNHSLRLTLLKVRRFTLRGRIRILLNKSRLPPGIMNLRTRESQESWNEVAL